MINLEENMTNLKNDETRVTVGDNRTLTGTKGGDWNRYKRREGKTHNMTLSNTDVITGLKSNLFSMTRSLQNVFQVTSESDILILKKNSTKIRFDNKMANNSVKGFLLTTKFYKSANSTDFLVPERQNTEGKEAVHFQEASVKKQENKTTKQLVTRKIHTNELHSKLSLPGEDRMCATVKNLHYSVKGEVDVYKDCNVEKIKNNCYIKWRRSVTSSQAK